MHRAASLKDGSKVKLADVEAQADPEMDEDARRKMLRDRDLKTKVVQGVGIASIALNLVSMIAGVSAITVLAGVIALAVAGVVIYYEFMIQDLDTLRNVQNDLRHHVNGFMEENEELVESNDQLQVKLEGLQETEKKLEAIAKENNTTATAFRSLLQENQTVMDAKVEAMQEEFMLELTKEILEADQTRGGEIGRLEDDEIDSLVRNLKVFFRNELDLNEDNFRSQLTKNRSLGDVIKAVQAANDPEIPPEDRMFVIKKMASP